MRNCLKKAVYMKSSTICTDKNLGAWPILNIELFCFIKCR